MILMICNILIQIIMQCYNYSPVGIRPNRTDNFKSFLDELLYK